MSKSKILNTIDLFNKDFYQEKSIFNYFLEKTKETTFQTINTEFLRISNIYELILNNTLEAYNKQVELDNYNSKNILTNDRKSKNSTKSEYSNIEEINIDNNNNLDNEYEFINRFLYKLEYKKNEFLKIQNIFRTLIELIFLLYNNYIENFNLYDDNYLYTFFSNNFDKIKQASLFNKLNEIESLNYIYNNSKNTIDNKIIINKKFTSKSSNIRIEEENKNADNYNCTKNIKHKKRRSETIIKKSKMNYKKNFEQLTFTDNIDKLMLLTVYCEKKLVKRDLFFLELETNLNNTISNSNSNNNLNYNYNFSLNSCDKTSNGIVLNKEYKNKVYSKLKILKIFDSDYIELSFTSIMPNLEFLYFNKCLLSFKNNYISHLNNLKELVLHNCSITNTLSSFIILKISNLRYLQVLDFSNNDISNIGLDYNILHSNCIFEEKLIVNIKSLILSNNKFSCFPTSEKFYNQFPLVSIIDLSNNIINTYPSITIKNDIIIFLANNPFLINSYINKIEYYNYLINKQLKRGFKLEINSNLSIKSKNNKLFSSNLYKDNNSCSVDNNIKNNENMKKEYIFQELLIDTDNKNCKVSLNNIFDNEINFNEFNYNNSKYNTLLKKIDLSNITSNSVYSNSNNIIIDDGSAINLEFKYESEHKKLVDKQENKLMTPTTYLIIPDNSQNVICSFNKKQNTIKITSNIINSNEIQNVNNGSMSVPDNNYHFTEYIYSSELLAKLLKGSYLKKYMNDVNEISFRAFVLPTDYSTSKIFKFVKIETQSISVFHKPLNLANDLKINCNIQLYLKELDLSGNNLSSSNIETILNNNVIFANLECLNLSNNNINNDIFKLNLGSVIKLKVLNLKSNNISYLNIYSYSDFIKDNNLNNFDILKENNNTKRNDYNFDVYYSKYSTIHHINSFLINTLTNKFNYNSYIKDTYKIKYLSNFSNKDINLYYNISYNSNIYSKLKNINNDYNIKNLINKNNAIIDINKNTFNDSIYENLFINSNCKIKFTLILSKNPIEFELINKINILISERLNNKTEESCTLFEYNDNIIEYSLNFNSYIYNILSSKLLNNDLKLEKINKILLLYNICLLNTVLVNNDIIDIIFFKLSKSHLFALKKLLEKT